MQVLPILLMKPDQAHDTNNPAPLMGAGFVTDALIRMDAPVAGLRPLRARRFTTSKLPKPTSWTFPFFFKDEETVLSTAARVSVAAFFEEPVPDWITEIR
jgi:hypothetical protein